MRVLVTGAGGFIGSHTVEALLRAGHEVTILVRNPTRAERALGSSWGDVEVSTGDVTDRRAVDLALAGCDSIVHLAGEIGVSAGTGPTSATANVDGVRTVLDAGLALGADPIVYTSTVMAYLPAVEEVLTRDSPLAAPLSVYGASKLAAELLVRTRQQEGAPVTSFVVGGVYGPRSPHRDGSFSAVLGALEFMMLAPPGGMGVVDVRDLALLLERSVERGQGPRHFMAGGRFVSWSEWTDLLAEAAGRPVMRQDVTRAEMVDLGKEFDRKRAEGVDTPGPLSEEAAIVMTSGVPTDDTATLEALGVTYRPTLLTFRDLVAYLRSAGDLPPDG